jgi:MFS family permease
LIAARFLFLFGIYATGRFLLFFVADRLGLDAGQAAEQAGSLLAGLALVTVVASPVTGWLADRIGRIPLMVIGSILGGVSSLLLIAAKTPFQILVFGGLMSIASAAFSGGSWALLADLVPKGDAARYFGLANFGTAGSAAAAGLLGPLMDASESVWQGSRFTMLFIGAAIAFIASALPIRNIQWKEVRNDRERDQTQGKAGADDSRLAVIPVPADLAPAEKDQDTS